MTFAELIVSLVEYWLYAGLLVAVLFLFVGIDRIDPASHNAYAFRPLLVPGILVLWPLVLWRWWTLEKLKRDGCPAADSGSQGEDT
ncbi:MAG: hypothetical protein AAF468_02985 [Pseudomonadota bacterium]